MKHIVWNSDSRTPSGDGISEFKLEHVQPGLMLQTAARNDSEVAEQQENRKFNYSRFFLMPGVSSAYG